MLLAEEEAQAANPITPPLADSALILVVEDDAALLRLIEKRLAAGGYRTIGVRDGASALACLDRDRPRLMLLDYGLPDMRGEELLERIESLGKHVPFVVATGHGSESVAVEMMKRGAYDYLVKGATFMKLLPAVIEQALERVRQAERLAGTEEQLRRAHDELEQRVRQRTAELAEANCRLHVEIEERRRAEEQVQQHQAELAHVARLSTVGEMVAELAHELNQPLSAISSYAQACKWLLQRGDPGQIEELSVALNQVSEQTDRAAEIIRRVRRFVAKAKPAQVTLDLNAVIRDVAELMNMDMRKAGAEVVLELTRPLPTVVGDRIQLEQVLVNLMRNGFDALRESDCTSRRLTVRTTVDGTGNIVVDVEDNGAGIQSDIADRVFDRFFTSKPDGMGLGLSISRSIIENHGGRLWLTPGLERGATLHFSLPIDTGEHNRGS
jgi:C4-dicarboxylate-specific signal transduction histidine kinase